MEGPDVGFAWAVASAACFMNFIMAGLGRMSGILFVAFIEFFQVDRKRASIPFSARSSARNLFGPVVGILGQKYGARKVIVSGSLIGSISCILCFFTTDIVWITILWGVINGLGTALTVTLPQVVIGQYFVKYRTTAAGMGFSGGCVGSFLFPVLIEYLLQNFGLEGTFLMIAALVMHTIPAALILRKPSWLNKKSPRDFKSLCVTQVSSDNRSDCNKNNARLEKHRLHNDLNNFHDTVIFSVQQRPFKNGIENPCMSDEFFPDVAFLKRNSELVVKLFSLPILSADILEIDFHEFSVMAVIQSLCQSQTYSKQIHESAEPPTQRLFYIGEDKEHLKLIADQQYRSFHLQRKPSNEAMLPRVHSVPDILVMNDEESRSFVLRKLLILRNVNEQQILAYFPEARVKIIRVVTELRKIRIPYDIEKLQQKEMLVSNSVKNNSEQLNSNSFAEHIKTAFKLYANPLFLMICICRSVHFITFVPAITTVVDFAMDKGLREEDGKYVIAAISLGDLLGRLCLGWITDRGFLPLPKYMMIVMVLQAISTASLPLMHTRITLFLNLALFGMLQGSLFVRHPVLVSKYMKKNEQSIAMGCVNFFSGLLGFGLPMYIGFFRDTIGSYDYIFYINGLIGGCVGLLWILEPLFLRCTHGPEDKKRPET
ncbi:uncharacterized protein [Parasteatoda tepidariorum]|uniref:uncharacterized protein n=1 Tax=Parasteatoda tepidariorum TaxID=114398 RepID=UPI0039BD58DF